MERTGVRRLEKRRRQVSDKSIKSRFGIVGGAGGELTRIGDLALGRVMTERSGGDKETGVLDFGEAAGPWMTSYAVVTLVRKVLCDVAPWLSAICEIPPELSLRYK